MKEKSYRTSEQKALRERSGSVDSKDPLVAFLYTLMRDHLAPGVVESIMKLDVDPFTDQTHKYTNGYLALYAKDLANRLKKAGL